MRATYHNAAFLAAGVPSSTSARFGMTDIVINSAERGAAVAEALGDKSVVLLRAHGFVAVGPSLQAAVSARSSPRSAARAAAGGRPRGTDRGARIRRKAARPTR